MIGNPEPFDRERLHEMSYMALRFLMLNRRAFTNGFTRPDGYDQRGNEAVRVVVCFIMTGHTGRAIGKENGQFMTPSNLFGCPVVIASDEELNGFLFILRDPEQETGVGLTPDHKIIKVRLVDGKYIPAEPPKDESEQTHETESE